MGLLATILQRATPENPRFSLLDPNAWDAFGADPSSSGIRVSHENALTYSPWWRAVTLISSDVAKLPLNIKKNRPDGGKDNDPRHAGYYLLRYEANEFQSAEAFKQQLTGHALTRGNGYAYILRDGSGAPIELLPLNPDQCHAVREVDMDTGRARIWYVLETQGEQRKLLPENVLHVYGFSFDGLQGYNVVDKAREALGAHMATARYASTYFRNAATPRVVLEYPTKMEDKAKEKLRESWGKLQTGLDAAHRTAVLDNGLKATPISFNAEDSQLIESRKFGPMDISNFTGVPPHKLGDREQAAYNSLESENQSYLDGCLDYWLVTWETQCRRRLLTEEEKRNVTHSVIFDRQKLIRANLQARGAYYVQALQNGWLSRDEVRDEEDRNPIPDGSGKTFLVALNMGKGNDSLGGAKEPADGDLKQLEDKTPKKDKDKAKDKAKKKEKKAALLADVTRRMVRRVNTHALRAAKDRKAFGEFIDGWKIEHYSVVRDAFAPVEDIVGFEVGSRAAALIHELDWRWQSVANNSSVKDLEATVSAMAARVEKELAAECYSLLRAPSVTGRAHLLED